MRMQFFENNVLQMATMKPDAFLGVWVERLGNPTDLTRIFSVSCATMLGFVS